MTLDDNLRSALNGRSLDGKLNNTLSIKEQSIQFVPATKSYECEARILKSKYVYVKTTTLGDKVSGQVQTRFESSHIQQIGGKFSSSPTNGYSVDLSSSHISVSHVPPPQFQIYPLDAIKLTWEDSLRASTGVGLNNLGNTCFLNSVLQVLANTPPLVNYLYSEDHSNQACPSQAGYCAICALRQHVKRIHAAAKSRQDSLSPQFIVQKLRCVMKSHSFGRQQDAHEFLRYFVDAMQNASLHTFKDKKLDLFTKETSAIGRIFGGFHKNDITCLCCRSISTTFDPFSDISLEIKQFNNIENSLKHFTRLETLSSDNAYKCPKCCKKVSAHKNYTIHVPPNVLTLQLKRFDHFGKIDKNVSFPEKLNIRPYMSQKQGLPVNYKLYGVVVHAGRSTNSGHYFAFVRNPLDQWHLMDDSRVCVVNLKSVLQTAAYILFYVRLPLQMATVKPQPKPAFQPKVGQVTSEPRNTPTTLSGAAQSVQPQPIFTAVHSPPVHPVAPLTFVPRQVQPVKSIPEASQNGAGNLIGPVPAGSTLNSTDLNDADATSSFSSSENEEPDVDATRNLRVVLSKTSVSSSQTPVKAVLAAAEEPVTAEPVQNGGVLIHSAAIKSKHENANIPSVVDSTLSRDVQNVNLRVKNDADSSSGVRRATPGDRVNSAGRDERTREQSATSTADTEPTPIRASGASPDKKPTPLMNCAESKPVDDESNSESKTTLRTAAKVELSNKRSRSRCSSSSESEHGKRFRPALANRRDALKRDSHESTLLKRDSYESTRRVEKDGGKSSKRRDNHRRRSRRSSESRSTSESSSADRRKSRRTSVRTDESRDVDKTSRDRLPKTNDVNYYETTSSRVVRNGGDDDGVYFARRRRSFDRRYASSRHDAFEPGFPRNGRGHYERDYEKRRRLDDEVGRAKRANGSAADRNGGGSTRDSYDAKRFKRDSYDSSRSTRDSYESTTRRNDDDRRASKHRDSERAAAAAVEKEKRRESKKSRREKRREERKRRKLLKKASKRETKRIAQSTKGVLYASATTKPALTLLSPLEFLKTFCSNKVKSWEAANASSIPQKDGNTVYSSLSVEKTAQQMENDCNDEYDAGRTKKVKTNNIDNSIVRFGRINLFQKALDVKYKKIYNVSN